LILAARGGRVVSVLHVVGVAVLVVVRGNSVGEGDCVVLYIACRPQRTQMDVRLAVRGIKAQELGRVRAGVNVSCVL
jgi:hypothetical protein